MLNLSLFTPTQLSIEMARNSYKALQELAQTTTVNLQRIGIYTKYKAGGNAFSYNVTTDTGKLAVSGKLSDCISFLNGINHIVNHNLFVPFIPHKVEPKLSFSPSLGLSPRPSFSNSDTELRTEGADIYRQSLSGGGVFECESDRGK